MATISTTQIDPRVLSFIEKPRKMLINSKWVDAVSGKTFPTYDPSTGEVLAQVDALLLQPVFQALKHLVQFLVHHHIGHIHVGVCH